MLRMLGAFLGVFCLLSLIVHLNQLTAVFGATGAFLFALDLALARLVKTPRTARLRDPIL